MSDWFCVNCGKRTGMYGHAFGPEAKANGGYSCDPDPKRVERSREEFRREDERNRGY